MAKVSEIKSSVSEKPKKEVIKTDELGRKLTIERPPYLRKLKLIKALGVLSENRVYLDDVLCVIWLKAIDGVPVQMPGSELELEALVNRLDYEGMQCVKIGMLELLGIDLGFDNDIEEQEIDSAKK